MLLLQGVCHLRDTAYAQYSSSTSAVLKQTSIHVVNN